MKKLLLAITIFLFLHNFLLAKDYTYTGPLSGRILELTSLELAYVSTPFITEKTLTGHSYAQIFFCGIDSDNNAHFLKRSKDEGAFFEIKLVVNLQPGQHIFLKLLETTVEIIITPINNSKIKIKLLPNEYTKEP